MLSQKLQKTLDFIGVSNAVIAQYAECDASLVSRLRSGARAVKPKSPSIRKVVNGIYLYCDEKNIVPAFCSLFNCDAGLGGEEIQQRFIAWLYDENGISSQKDTTEHRRRTYTHLGCRLDALMTLADISNIRLSKLINFDSSYISRIRNGLRTPRSNPAVVRSICGALADRILAQGKLSEAAALMNVLPEIITTPSVLESEIYSWLCDTDSESALPEAELLLDKIETFSAPSDTALPQIIPDPNDNADLYKGTEGLRKAVLRLLYEAANAKDAELWLYSDQDMEWMVGDKEYRIKWFSLMVKCALSGVKIKIIHNIDRSAREMMSAINSWVPLYMFGSIEPYYCTRPSDSRFSHTIFLLKDAGCISGFHARSFEENGIYSYYTDAEQLSFFAAEYEGMLKLSNPLLRLYAGMNLPEELSQTAKDISFVLETPSIATMPEKLLKSMLSRSELSEGDAETIAKRWKLEKSRFEANLKKGYIHEFLPNFADNVIFSGGIQSDLADGIFYTPPEFSEHIKHILYLMDKNANYRVYILPEMPFSNIRILSDNERAIVVRNKEPRLSFVFTHPLMRSAFENYISQLRRGCEPEKAAVRRHLLGYI